MAAPKKMKISQLEEITRTPRTTIHYYIREGLLTRPDKTGKTMAYYDSSHVRRLELIRKIQKDYTSRKNKSYMPISLLKEKLEEETRKISEYGEFISGAAGEGTGPKRSRRMEIIEAAFRLYSEKGYYSTNVRDIAREAGISPSAFYIYFPDKRELFGEVIDFVIAGISSDLRHALEEEDEMRRPVVFLKVFRDNYPKMGEILSQLRAGVALDDRWARDKLNKVYWDMTKVMAGEVKNAADAGLTRETDPELLAFFIVGMAEIVINLTSLYDKYSYERLALFASDLYVNGVAPRDDRSRAFYKKLIEEIVKALPER